MTAALLAALFGVAGGGCSTTVTDSSSGGGGSSQEGPPKTWCSLICGVVASPDACGGGNMTCAAGEVCAADHLSSGHRCCDPVADSSCAFFPGPHDVPGEPESTKLYCSPGVGWLRVGDPKDDPNPETVCAPDETCAARRGNYRQVCCDPRKDPLCGRETKECAVMHCGP